jgi:hypothetical protein
MEELETKIVYFYKQTFAFVTKDLSGIVSNVFYHQHISTFSAQNLFFFL